MKPDCPVLGTLQSLLTWGTCSDCAVHSFSVSFIGHTGLYHLLPLYWLSEAELGLASVTLTRMLSVSATHCVSSQQPRKGSPVLLPPLF